MAETESAHLYQPLLRYRFPLDSDAPEVKRFRSLAAQSGRALARGASASVRTKAAQARAKLAESMAGLDVPRLRYWAELVMIDGRWNGATGEGGYWAAGTAAVNEAAKAELRRRGLSAERPMFELV